MLFFAFGICYKTLRRQTWKIFQNQFQKQTTTASKCKYFTSKEENQNYLEIHHLVPREFSYEFDTSIEFVDNYIPLCPHCHRKIHKAVDRERIPMINFLFNIKKDKFKENNLLKTVNDKNLDIKLLHKFYHVNEEEI
ncbi:MAG: hypothetical protein E7375_00040 [Clostridiales bacterium]|nr:hypothetical protein [Clostridiales bacterium]